MPVNLVALVKDLLENESSKAILVKHLGLEPNVSATQILAVLKLVCAGAAVACPIIDSL